jgi:hypothetical protein
MKQTPNDCSLPLLTAPIRRDLQTYNRDMAEDMLGALTAFYKENKIYSCEFDCQHFDSCRKSTEKLAKHSQFTKATSAYVGTEYERGLGPRGCCSYRSIRAS